MAAIWCQGKLAFKTQLCLTQISPILAPVVCNLCKCDPYH